MPAAPKLEERRRELNRKLQRSIRRVGAYLGEFEQLVLLAILRLGDEASGSAIRDAVEDGSGRTVWIGAIYTTLQRMADKGLVTSSVPEVRESGARKRKIFGLSAEGRAALGQAYETWARMTRGLKPKLESM
jgi:DNA-binding PadR family transcriptional regulator